MAKFHILSSPTHLATTVPALQLFPLGPVPGPDFYDYLPSSNLFVHLLLFKSLQPFLMSHELIRKIRNFLVRAEQRITVKEELSRILILPNFKNSTSNAF